MVGEWRETTWGEEISLEYGKAIRGYNETCGKYRVFGSNGAVGWTDNALTEGPGVILGRKGAYRGVQFWREPFWVIDTAYYVVPKTKLDMRWLYYAIKHYKLGEIDDGSPIPSTTRAAVYVQELTVPSLEEQRAIAHILGVLDDKIELNQRMNQTLEAMARALFKSRFVDFDGVPPEDMQESALGLIPKGWRVGALTDLALLNPETWTKQTRPDEVRYVDLSNTKWGRIESVTPYAAEDAPSRAQRVLRPNDTIVGTVRPGNGSYALIDEDGLTGSTGFAVLRPKRDEYAALVYLAAAAPDNIEALANLADGGAYPAVRAEVVAATHVVIADEGTIAKFAQCVSPLLEKIAKNERQSRTLAQLRDTLLPKLISGELRVKDAGRFQGETT